MSKPVDRNCESKVDSARGVHCVMHPVTSKKNNVAVIILTLDQKEKTVRCLSSFRTIKFPRYEIFLWDNGSVDGTTEAVKKLFPEVIVHYHESNIGAAAGRNAAAELAINTYSPSHLLFIDNDTVVNQGFLKALLEPFESDEKLGQTSAKIRFLKDKERINDAGGSKIEFWKGSTKPIGSGEIDVGQYDKRTICIAPTGCMMVRTDVFQEVGGFDPKFDPYGYEDLDLSLRIRKLGYYGLYIPEALIYHDPSRSNEERIFAEGYLKQKTRNWFLFLRRHASLREQIGFILLGIPFIFPRAVYKGVKKGNLTFFKGMLSGFLAFCKSSFTKDK